MPQHRLSHAGNPFMLMLNPEVVLDSMKASENLERLSRRVCHPLDRVAPATPAADIVTVGFSDLDAVGNH